MPKRVLHLLLGLFLLFPINFAGGFDDISALNQPGDEYINYSFPTGLKIGLNAGYYSTSSAYDKDGNTNDFFSGGIESEFYGKLKFSYRLPYDEDEYDRGGFRYKVASEFSFLRRNYSQDASGQAPAVDQSGSGLQSVYFKGSVSTGNLFNSSLGAKLYAGYQLDTGPDPEPNELGISDRQNALQAGLGLKYITPKFSGFAGTDYVLTFARTQNDKDFDAGDYFNVRGGASYNHQFDCGAKLRAGLELNFQTKSNSSFDGNEIQDSDSNLLSLSPFISYNYQNWGVALGGFAYDEYRLKRGIIPLSGKNINKPGFVGTIRTTFRF